MKRSKIDGLFHWGRYQPERRIDFNGFFWARPGGGVLFDPMELSAHERGALDEAGGANRAILTNFDHLRATVELKAELGLEVFAPAEERERFGAAAPVVDVWYTAREGLPEELGIEAHELVGGKSPVEMALYLRPIEALVFGDLVRCHESGRLRLLPDEKIADRAQLAAGLRLLSDLPKQAVCLGDGECVWFGADEAYSELLASL